VTSSVTPALAAQVKTRAVGRCEYCHAPQVLIGQAFHIDHIVPRSVGGRAVTGNLCLACSHCNIAKGNQTRARDSRTGRVVSMFNPRADSWETHFRWSSDWTRLIGRNAVGRATVAALKMNASILRRARPYWRVVGLIP
jgi:HNH endonuclease